MKSDQSTNFVAVMNPLQRALIEKAGHDNGFENVLPSSGMGVELRQRVGQQAYRQAMLDYWGGACAVTGLAWPQALRASHAKPWAKCASCPERLDVFNGLLLSANLDVLFESFLVSFPAFIGSVFAVRTPPHDHLRP